jgi:shikimate kinase
VKSGSISFKFLFFSSANNPTLIHLASLRLIQHHFTPVKIQNKCIILIIHVFFPFFWDFRSFCSESELRVSKVNVFEAQRVCNASLITLLLRPPFHSKNIPRLCFLFFLFHFTQTNKQTQAGRMERKQLVVLCGPKGSGKSFIGQLLQEKHKGNTFFVNVERIFMEIRNGRDWRDANYIREGYAQLKQRLKELLESEQAINVLFETTGASAEVYPIINELEKECGCRVLWIRVKGTLEACVERVASRNADEHLPASPELVTMVFNKCEEVLKERKWDLELMNVPFLSSEEILQSVGKLS